MNHLQTIVILLAAYLAVFAEAYFSGVRDYIGAQIDVLPTLAVYCGLTANLTSISILATGGGLFYDTLSANPLGVSVLPLFIVGFAARQTRDLVLREETYARFLLGTAASALAPFLTVLLLWGGGSKPLIGWGTLWQWLVMAVGGGALAPFCFWFFDRVRAALSYSSPSESTFRPDREIKRGRG